MGATSNIGDLPPVPLRFISPGLACLGVIADRSLCMKPVTRRRAIKLASSFLATAPLLGGASRAQPASSTGAIVFDMANFLGAGGDADTTLAKALAANSKRAEN